VKIRGVRIELAEVEAALRECDGVADAVTRVWPDGAGRDRLVAYIVPLDGLVPTLAALRSRLRDSLPDAFLPTALVILDGLPLTTSGKVDRRALPQPDRSVALGPGRAASALEATLARIWSDVLRNGEVGLDDDFFDLGGHSLLATQIVSRVRTTLGIDLALRTFFDSPTVAAVAAAIERLGPASEPDQPIVPLARGAKAARAGLADLSDDQVEVALRLARLPAREDQARAT
jgi:acyl carrier protein